VTTTTLARLRARGTVIIEADRDGIRVSWWPRGQKGWPLCGHGRRGVDLEAMLTELEEETRPRWYPDVESVREAREAKAEHDRAARQRSALRTIDRVDRLRERWSREREQRRLDRPVRLRPPVPAGYRR
jgi:hypothetical protein